jgi:Asp-tRNA(Asn)/Glu-tRNA(Gln) amidotransferase A subunit family amidase
LGKTVTTEFAYFEPGPTRNPRNLDFSPGGSSSGSAAAVAAGFCPLAIGTQTIGSTIRPAAFCGIVGFKSSYGRISMAGGILCSDTFDHVGVFTQDVAGMELSASLLCQNWREVEIKCW